MPISINAFANPIPQLLEIIPDLRNLKPFKEVAEEGLNLAKKVDADVAPIMPKLGTVEEGIRAAQADLLDVKNVRLPELDNVIKGVKEFTDEELLKLGSKYDTLDAKVLAQVQSLEYLQDGFTEVSGKVRTLEPIVDDTKKTITTVVTEVAENKQTIGKVLGDLADVAGKLFDILGLIATLGTAVRMEQIYAELKDVDNFLLDAIAVNRQGLESNNARDDVQQNDIDYLLDKIRNLDNMNETQFNALMGNINNTREHVQANYTQINLTKDLIEDKTTEIIAEINDINVPNIPSIKNALCEAFNDCSPLPGMNERLSEIKAILGNGRIECGTTFVAGNITDGIRAIYCNDNNNGGNNPDIDIQFEEQDLKLDELLSLLKTPINLNAWNYEIILNPTTKEYELKQLPPQLSASGQGIDGLGKAIDVIAKRIDNDEKIIFEMLQLLPEPTLFVPDEWRTRLEGNIPQIIAGMRDKATAGTVMSSHWNIVVPHPRKDVLNLTWDDLVQFFPDYTRGSWSATVKLKDGSAVRVRANTQSNATSAVNRLLELVDPLYRLPPDQEFPLYQQNKRFKDVLVTCRGIGFYEKGRTEGEKPTKRWYFPVKET